MKGVYVATRAYAVIAISMFAMVVAILAANVNPPVVDSQKAEMKAPGDIVVHAVWPNGNIDVDLWLSGPDEPIPVGYSNKGGLVWNLLRDDLGDSPDATPINYEDAFTRGMPPGEYVVNVQCFRCHLTELPMPVDVGVSIRKRTGTEGLENLVITKVMMKVDGQEKTAVRFIVKPDGTVDPESVNNVYKKLRGNKPKQESTPYWGGGGGMPIPPQYQQGDK
jgi:hypothetical protein